MDAWSLNQILLGQGHNIALEALVPTLQASVTYDKVTVAAVNDDQIIVQMPQKMACGDIFLNLSAKIEDRQKPIKKKGIGLHFNRAVNGKVFP